MAFLVYQRTPTGLTPTGETFSLAGYNLIHTAWKQRGRPVNRGWHITADELITIYSKEADNAAKMALLIDFDLNARWRIGIIEILDIYVYTYGEDDGKPTWSPLMLRLRDILYEEYDPEIDDDQKNTILATLPDPEAGPDFVEFLYLTGPWSWGKNGMTNAAFIHGPAREYFCQFFCPGPNRSG